MGCSLEAANKQRNQCGINNNNCIYKHSDDNNKSKKHVTQNQRIGSDSDGNSTSSGSGRGYYKRQQQKLPAIKLTCNQKQVCNNKEQQHKHNGADSKREEGGDEEEGEEATQIDKIARQRSVLKLSLLCKQSSNTKGNICSNSSSSLGSRGNGGGSQQQKETNNQSVEQQQQFAATTIDINDLQTAVIAATINGNTGSSCQRHDEQQSSCQRNTSNNCGAIKQQLQEIRQQQQQEQQQQQSTHHPITTTKVTKTSTQQQQYEPPYCIRHTNSSYTGTASTPTIAARTIVNRMANATIGSNSNSCRRRGCNIHELLWHAGNTLTMHLSSASQSLIEHLSYCAAAMDACNLAATMRQEQQQQQQQQYQRRLCGWRRRQQHAATCCRQAEQQHLLPTGYGGTNSNSSANNNNAAYNYIGHNYYHLVRNSISFYAASSVILVLCYLTTTTSAAANSEAATVDKHPINSIDWSKFDESSSDKEILDLLLEKKRYDKRLLPPVNDEDFCCGLSSPDMAKNQNTRRPHRRGTLTVNVNVLLLSLASPDESSLKYEVEFLLNQQWNDPRLQYGNKSHYDFLNALHHHDSIWTPDTYFIMHGDFKDPIIPMHFALRIYRNGTITYAMRRHLILSCQGSLHIFPFDDPKCSFSMESISYEEAQIKYVWKNDEDTLRKSPSLTTLNAYLVQNRTTPCDQNSWRGNYSCLRVDLIFTRDRAFYFTTVFIPGIILVTSSFITFWLEWNAVPARSMIGNYSCLQVEMRFTRDRAYYFTTVFIPGIILVTSSFITFWLEWNAVPARVMIGVTTMLNFFTTSNGFRSTLPVVSNLTAMNVWDGVCMCFIYASLLEFVCVNYVGRKRPLHNVVYRPGENPVTQRLPAVLSRIGVILASPLEVIEREFHAALSSEKAATGASSTAGTVTPTAAGFQQLHLAHHHCPHLPQQQQQQPVVPSRIRWEEQHGGIIGVAVQNIRARSIRRRDPTNVVTDPADGDEPIYAEVQDPSLTLEDTCAAQPLRRTQSMSTNTPSLFVRGDNAPPSVTNAPEQGNPSSGLDMPDTDIEQAQREQPVPPPRRKTSRSTSPASTYTAAAYDGVISAGVFDGTAQWRDIVLGEKRRDAGAPNEMVACTTCAGSSSPCTHSANNGCATETCFVQVRKKEPPHPIRVAKTIDVIARITFPTAYAIFLIFFFVHYNVKSN